MELSVVSILSRLWGGILVEARDFSASGCPDWLSAHPGSGCLPRRWRRHDVDHLPPSSAEVKTEWNFYLQSSCMPSWHVHRQLYLPVSVFLWVLLYSVYYIIFGIVGIS